MRKFIKIGGLYVRPEDVVHFQSNSTYSDRSVVKFKDGSEWNIHMKAEAIAALLNEVQP